MAENIYTINQLKILNVGLIPNTFSAFINAWSKPVSVLCTCLTSTMKLKDTQNFNQLVTTPTSFKSLQKTSYTFFPNLNLEFTFFKRTVCRLGLQLVFLNMLAYFLFITNCFLTSRTLWKTWTGFHSKQSHLIFPLKA